MDRQHDTCMVDLTNLISQRHRFLYARLKEPRPKGVAVMVSASWKGTGPKADHLKILDVILTEHCSKTSPFNPCQSMNVAHVSSPVRALVCVTSSQYVCGAFRVDCGSIPLWQNLVPHAMHTWSLVSSGAY
jgi:hypothetical protein